MLTIKTYLAESGAVADLHKDFPLFQGQFQNVLLNAFVPTSLLAPNFSVLAENTDEVISPFVAGTAVKCAMRTIARNGAYHLSAPYYLRFVKTLVKDGVSYALFERNLPKEFSTYAGQGINAPTLIFNIENVEYGEIDSATATSSDESLSVSVNLNIVKANLPALSYDYTFVYSTGEETPAWYLDGYSVVLSDYGITVTGTPEDEDEITLSVTASTPTVISIMTTQEVKMDVMPSASFTAEPEDASIYDEIMAEISGILADLRLKQNITDYGLQTNAKTVVGAINEVFDKSYSSEDYIGTYTYSASSILDLPSNSDLLAFAKSERGDDYTLKNGDVIIVVQDLTDAPDNNYKYIYNGNSWVYYKISSYTVAGNGVEGVVAGTYGVGKTYNVLVDISNGEIVNIYVKNTLTGNYDALAGAFMPISIGATRQYVRDYALPREFNDVLYLTDNGYETEITSETAVEETTNTDTVGDTDLISAEYTVGELEFQLANKNSYKSIFYLSASENISVRFLLTTEFKHGNETEILLSAELSNLVDITTEPQKIEFSTAFSGLNNTVLNVEEGDKIIQTLAVRREESTSVDFTVYSTTVIPSRFYLLTNVIGISNAKVVQETGNSRVDVMSQDAVTRLLVPKLRTIAGIDLADDITAQELRLALSVPVVDSALSNSSENPVQNKVITIALNTKVPITRTIAGIPLNADITADALKNVLVIDNSTLPFTPITDAQIDALFA